MRLLKFYNQIIKFGRECDPRDKKQEIKSYEDTAILYGAVDTEVKGIMLGIDIESPELLLADNLRKRNKRIDLVISHHPEGKAYASLYEVMRLQVDLLIKAGICADVAQQLLEERMQEVLRKILPQNHMRTVDTASLLDIPFMCVHTPADNHASSFIQHLLDKEKPKKLKDILEILYQIPEYKEAEKNNAGPRIILGNPNRTAGRIFVEMTGGTEGPKDSFENLSKVGVRTIVAMHLSEEHFKKVRDTNLNVVIAGHISSDTLGLNLLLDKIERESKEEFDIFACSGFRRFKRY
ncbi:MAG: NGG1p interacting factor NIF3 [Candidatus Omnitrophica bacterium]|nr:NGG1p interacting factor NIF3 [Candidatus Omnitrophota bacterium]